MRGVTAALVAVALAACGEASFGPPCRWSERRVVLEAFGTPVFLELGGDAEVLADGGLLLHRLAARWESETAEIAVLAPDGRLERRESLEAPLLARRVLWTGDAAVLVARQETALAPRSRGGLRLAETVESLLVQPVPVEGTP